MKEAFTHWRELKQRLEPGHNVLWLFDLDGTLVPLEEHPRKTHMTPPVRKALRVLEHRYPGRVGVLSGRSLKDLRKRVGLGKLFYGGTHGFEVLGPRLRYEATVSALWMRKLKTLTRAIAAHVKGIPGFWMEKKKFTRCLHYRQVAKRDLARVFRQLREITRIAKKVGFRIQPGYKNIEVIPSVGWSKGHAARWIMNKVGAGKVFFVGDDTTDENVFRAFGPSHAMIRVGRNTQSKAGYFLKNQREILPLLGRLNNGH